ncbi:hypothetical protein PPACK8108_LOCUS345 [Phakopsora pachyrhizi]|uniref:Uncharacterized protein n=1 Tax=Phakopsora pachyrhizi TaxID=170000 RepID=A0AAV0ADD8_PHAPC|nr:hypothetical protein PPACK8108_LOCUS345 [Phakopsora pachyrhizi]
MSIRDYDSGIFSTCVPTDEIPITTNDEILGIRIRLKVAASVEEKDALELALFAENKGENKNNGSRSQSHVAKAVTHSMAQEFLTNNVEPQEVQNTQETQIVIEAPQEDAQESEMNIRQYKLFPTNSKGKRLPPTKTIESLQWSLGSPPTKNNYFDKDKQAALRRLLNQHRSVGECVKKLVKTTPGKNYCDAFKLGTELNDEMKKTFGLLSGWFEHLEVDDYEPFNCEDSKGKR